MKIKKTQLRILVRQALLENKSLDPALKYDTPLYKRLRKDPNFQSSSIKIKKAISGLVLLKEELMSELGIDKSLYNTLCLVALGIFGRETKFGSAKSYYLTEPIEVAQSVVVNATVDFFRKNFGIDDPFKSATQAISDIDPTDTLQPKSGERLDTSIGATQIVYGKHFKEGTPLFNLAKKIGIDSPVDLTNSWKAIVGTLAIMNNIYKYAAVSGYDENSPGINDTIDNLQSTGNAQLDISIMAYNIGPGNAINSGFGYCGKESIKKKCHSPGQSNRVHNYLPNYRTGKITSIGYLEEVAGYMESFSWIRKYI